MVHHPEVSAMKFALVVMETEASRRSIREDRAEHRRLLETWWADQMAAGRVIGGEAFETEKMAPVTVRRDASGAVTATEGPFAGEAETLGGYVLVEAPDRDAAVAVARSWPTAETIEVRPIWAGVGD
jgi:hypothetical protein